MIKNKIKTRNQIKNLIKGKKVGFTSGSFDIMHAGHAVFFEEAKKLCDVLVVAVNSDDSVRSYKGSDRPIVPQKERAMMVASMEAVDYVFLFDERRNNINIETLKPDLYIKAGDYTISKMTSTELVEKNGGKAVILPHYKGFSTTKMIKKIIKIDGKNQENTNGIYSEIMSAKKQGPVVFIDRDGTINENVGYLHEPEKFKLLKNAGEGMKKLYDMDFRLAVVTNQPGIGMGYFEKEDFFKVNQAMFKAIGPFKILIEKIYFCPHSAGEKCECRKPGIGLFLRAKKEMKVNLKECFMIGDMDIDMQAGKKAGLTTILIGKDKNIKADYYAKDLLDAADWILLQQRK
ncbi:HAD-IIIA family hydrolase [Candidatus Woesearchaeota archaeon]|nr:HAD-IIIA family hydrolase [Candidatus Woesearchaeota archaeon]